MWMSGVAQCFVTSTAVLSCIKNKQKKEVEGHAQPQLPERCWLCHGSPSQPLPFKKVKNNSNKKKITPQPKDHQSHAGSTAVSSCPGLLGAASLLGVLLLALLGPILAGLLLLLAPLVLFVLVAPVALPLLALVLLPGQGTEGTK